MKNTSGGHALSPSESQLIEQLRQHPELRARFQSILDLTGNADGPLPTADVVEARLILELRQVGPHHHESVGQAGRGARERGTPAPGRHRTQS